MTCHEHAAVEERAYVCERCHKVLGVKFFDRRWVCAECAGILDWRLLWRELQIPPGFQD